MGQRSEGMELIARLIIFLLPTLAAAGADIFPIRIGGVTVYAFRIAVCLLPFSLLAIGSFRWFTFRDMRLVAVTSFLWVTWGIASLYWTPDIGSGIKEVLAIILGIILIGCLSSVRHHVSISSLILGWVASFLITATIAVWELITKEHLPSYYVEHLPGYSRYILNQIVLSTFNNPNDYGAYLLVAVPFVGGSCYVYFTRRYVKNITLFAVLCLSGLLVFFTMSRTALMGFIAQFMTAWYIQWKMERRRSFLLAITPILFFMLLLSAMTFANGNYVIFKKILNAVGEFEAGGSLWVRFNLVLAGLWIAVYSGGAGVGAGGFSYAIERLPIPVETRGYVNPHNFLIELASQYGIIVCACFLVLQFSLFRSAWRLLKTFNNVYNDRDYELAKVVVCGMVGYWFSFVSSSSYIKSSVNWLFLSSVITLISYLESQSVSYRFLHDGKPSSRS